MDFPSPRGDLSESEGKNRTKKDKSESFIEMNGSMNKSSHRSKESKLKRKKKKAS